MRHTPTAQREAVAAEVRSWMGRRRMTQTELAVVLDKSQAYVSRRLGGEVAFDTDDLYVLADHFGIEVADLLGRPYTAWFTAADAETRDAVRQRKDVVGETVAVAA